MAEKDWTVFDEAVDTIAQCGILDEIAADADAGLLKDRDVVDDSYALVKAIEHLLKDRL